MGRTVESYRLALEDEIRCWCGFEKTLRGKERESFEKMMDACRIFASAGSNAVQPVLFEPMVMSILLFQQERIRALETVLNDLRRRLPKE